MSGFKLIAIRPLSGCEDKFLKVLSPETVYSFYNDYKLLNDKGAVVKPQESVHEIEAEITVPSNLYNTSGLEINISAVVGKNGSGKSALIEFLLYMVYYIGTEIGTIEPYYKKLERDKRNASATTSIYYESDEFEKQLEFEKQEHNEIINKLRGSLYYEINGVFYELEIGSKTGNIKIAIRNSKADKTNNVTQQKRNILLKELLNDNSEKLWDKELLNHFFYSIVINYSHYALNSKQIGNWINCLFHKNDGYRTPAVVNPMRDEGNFDINDEIEFANYRLLFNLIVRRQIEKAGSLLQLTDNQFVRKIRFTFNREKVTDVGITTNENGISGKLTIVNLLLDLQSVFFDTHEQAILLTESQPFQKEIFSYLYNKINKVSNTYSNYSQGYNFEEGSSYAPNILFLEKLRDDGSHVVFKIKQAINFLKNNQRHRIWQDSDKNAAHEFTLEELTNWIAPENTMDIMNQLPPAIFKIDILLGDQSSDETKVKFSQMSSGEQQIIHSVQSVIYHLVNLNSVHFSAEKQLSYKAINIIFDEIELYYHPDFQRVFVHELIKSFDRLNFGHSEKGIKYLNIIFSTHSPFILSDIPKQNILMLEYKSDKRKTEQISNKNQTFGANIHELLANDFFLKNGFIGEFSKNKILEVVKFIEKKPSVISSHEEVTSIINIIGEPILKERLEFMYNQSLGEKTKDQIIRELMEENNRLKTQGNAKN